VPPFPFGNHKSAFHQGFFVFVFDIGSYSDSYSYQTLEFEGTVTVFKKDAIKEVNVIAPNPNAEHEIVPDNHYATNFFLFPALFL